MEKYKKFKDAEIKKRKKPATEEELAKMKSDYKKHVDKLPDKGKIKKKKKKFWSIYD
tara:strand:+ start:2650 stop:2820 length:171 start_codon:yes stop_codon:yes gene_type:complete